MRTSAGKGLRANIKAQSRRLAEPEKTRYLVGSRRCLAGALGRGPRTVRVRGACGCGGVSRVVRRTCSDSGSGGSVSGDFRIDTVAFRTSPETNLFHCAEVLPGTSSTTPDYARASTVAEDERLSKANSVSRASIDLSRSSRPNCADAASGWESSLR